MLTKNLLKRTAVSLVALIGALGAALSARAEPNYLILEHAPTDPADATVEVSLDGDGHWSQIDTVDPFWRLKVGANWETPPIGEFTIGLNIRHHTAPLSKPCNADVCEGGNWYGHTVWTSAELNDPPSVRTLAAPYHAVFAEEGINTQPNEMCAASRYKALQSGSSLNEVLSQGFVLETTALVYMVVHYWSGGYGDKEIDVPVKVHCVGDPVLADQLDPPFDPNAADDIAAGFQVTDASLVLFPGYKGEEHACPVDLTMFGKITAAGHGPAEVSYRFRWASGPVSTVFTTTIEDTVEDEDVSHQVSIPLPPAIQSPPQGGGGPVAPEGMGGFAPQPGPGDGMDVPTPDPGPTLADHEIPGNAHKDSIRLEIVGPTKGVTSDWEPYHVVCKPSVTPGLEPPDTVGIEPRTPVSPETPRVAMPDGGTPERGGTRRTDPAAPSPGAGAGGGRAPTMPDSSVPLPGSAAGAGGGMTAPSR